MILQLLVFALTVVVAFAVPTPEFEPVPLYYHENIGIKEAARIKALEEAVNGDPDFSIVGGGAASLGQYPHLGGLLITLQFGGTSVCGSSLISNTRLVTAAHCWFDGRSQARSLEVVLGSIKLFSGGTRIKTNTVRMHELWDPNSLKNDIAVISIPPVTYSSYIRNIALPTGGPDFVGWNAANAGFGKIKDGADISPNQSLHHVALQIITNAKCQETFGDAILPSNICTDGSAGRSPCSGDSGGPLQVNNGGPILVGIASFVSRAGCEKGFPAAFTRVTSYLNWIQARL